MKINIVIKMKLKIAPFNFAKKALKALPKAMPAVKARLNKVREVLLYGKKKKKTRNPSRITDQTRQFDVEDIDKSADAFIKKIWQQWTLEKQQEMEKVAEEQRKYEEANNGAEDDNFISAMNTTRNPSRTTDLLSHVEDIDKSADAYIKKTRQQWTLEKQQEMVEKDAERIKGPYLSYSLRWSFSKIVICLYPVSVTSHPFWVRIIKTLLQRRQ